MDRLKLFILRLIHFIMQMLYVAVVFVTLLGEGLRVIIVFIVNSIWASFTGLLQSFAFIFLFIKKQVLKRKNFTPLKKKSGEKSKKTPFFSSLKKQRAQFAQAFKLYLEKKAAKKPIQKSKQSQALFILSGILLVFIMLFIFAYTIWVWLLKDLPSPYNIGKVNYGLSTQILDRNGVPLYQVFRDQNRVPVKLAELPAHVPQAFIAIEDKQFYSHFGIAPVGGILRAIKDNVTTGSVQGGSTITQQLVKFSLLTPKKTLKRKLQEMILAVWAERIYTKDQILEMYLNHVSFGGSTYGVQQAAKTYFSKDAKNLSTAEAALLAGLPQAPSRYSPFVNPSAAIARREEVLERMYEEGFINREQLVIAQSSIPQLAPNSFKIRAPHFVFYVKNLLEQKYGSEMVEEGGLIVKTTIDTALQEKMEKIVKDEIATIKRLNVTNGAGMITKPQTGEILAMVGSTDYFASPSGSFNVATAYRQPGSMLKPLLYSMALERGFTAGTILEDTPVTYKLWGSETYSPVNYDGRFHGRVSLRYALANSYNVPAVKTLHALGVSNYIDYANSLGISTWVDKSRYGLALALGGGEVTMVDVARAFSSLANLGETVDVNPILEIKDYSGKVLYEAKPSKKRVMKAETAYIINDILSDTVARSWAFGTRNNLTIPGYKVAVKTGTTNDKRDNWTIGYNSDVLTVVWVGNNDYSPMNRSLTSGITGAAPIWNKAMTEALKLYSSKTSWYQQPPTIVEKVCFAGRRELFIKGTENSVPCTLPTPSPAESEAALTPSPAFIREIIDATSGNSEKNKKPPGKDKRR